MGSEATIIVENEFEVDQSLKDDLKRIAEVADVERVVGSIDIGPAESETPESIAVATKDIVYPEFCSNVVNCGMSLLRTGLHEDDITDEFLERLCERLDSPDEDFRPERGDLNGMLERGAEYVVNEWGFDAGVLDNIENRGNLFESGQPTLPIRKLVPPWILHHPKSRQDTPIPNLSGNHFIEFQTVSEILDPQTASEWGLEEGEVLVAMHGDYNLTLYINWHYANRFKLREHAEIPAKLKLRLSKTLFHFWSGGIRSFPENWRQYNDSALFSGLDTNTPQGQRYIEAHHAAMNFGYANRLLANQYIAAVLSDLTPSEQNGGLLWDVGHDTIQQETIGGEQYWIHRKALGNSIENKPAFISGSYNMDSFLGKGRPNAESHLRSYDHGSGNVVDYFESTEGLDALPDTTRMFSLQDGGPIETVDHISRKPIERVAESVESNEILSGVAWLRPIANIDA